MIEIITYDEKTVQALHDALLYDGIIGNDVILSGMELSELGGQNFTLDITAGYGVIQGRVFKFDGGSVDIAPPTSGTTNGQIIIQIDLSNDEEPIKIFSDNTMRSLRKDENFNIMKGVWETQYCTYNVYESGTVAPTYPQSMKAIESINRTQSNLATLQDTVSTQGTRINNQANRLTTLETKTTIEETNITSGMSNVTNIRGYTKSSKVGGFCIANCSFNVTSQIPAYPSSTILKGLGAPGYEMNVIICSRDNAVSKCYPCYIRADGDIGNRVAMPTGAYVINVCYKML